MREGTEKEKENASLSFSLFSLILLRLCKKHFTGNLILTRHTISLTVTIGGKKSSHPLAKI